MCTTAKIPVMICCFRCVISPFAVVKSCNYHARAIRHVRRLLTESVAQTLATRHATVDSITATRCCTVLQRPLLTSYKEHKTMQLVQSWAPTVDPTPNHYFDNVTGYQYANASSTRQRCWRVEWTRLVSRPNWIQEHLVQRVPSRQTCLAASPLLSVRRLTVLWFRKTFILLRHTCHLEQSAYRSHHVRFKT